MKTAVVPQVRGITHCLVSGATRSADNGATDDRCKKELPNARAHLKWFKLAEPPPTRNVNREAEPRRTGQAGHTPSGVGCSDLAGPRFHVTEKSNLTGAPRRAGCHPTDNAC
jgi:hypothetical protein